jgi:hypothetical protein
MHVREILSKNNTSSLMTHTAATDECSRLVKPIAVPQSNGVNASAVLPMEEVAAEL